MRAPLLALLAFLLAGSLSPPDAGTLQGSSPDTAAFRAKVHEVLGAVSDMRALEPLRPVEPWLQSREELAAYVGRQFERERASGRLRSEGRILALLGLLPDGYSLEDSLLAVYGEQVGGIYDHHSDRLFLADWLSPELQAPVMSHEIVHALQDQRYEIGLRLDGFETHENDDEIAAFMALIEGDATAVMMEMSLGAMGLDAGTIAAMGDHLRDMLSRMSGDMPRLAGAPRIVRESLLFPYVEGTLFVLAVRRSVPWSGFEKVYSRPPRSTKEILHPEVYLADAESAPRLSWSGVPQSLAARGFATRYENTLGEWTLRFLLAESAGDSAAAACAAGWSADRMMLLAAPDGTEILLVSTLWDTEADADEFFAAVSAMLLDRDPGGQTDIADGPDGGVIRRRGGATGAWAERRADRVMIGLGPIGASREEAQRFEQEIWESAAVARSF